MYVRNLPHWRQRGATYFVTLRQDDSIPKAVVQQWRDERNGWYQAHGLDITLKDSSPDVFVQGYAKIPKGVRRSFERLQARRLHDELDRCHGSCVLQASYPQKELANSLSHFHGTRLRLGDLVIMPNHIHAIITPIDDWELEDLLGSIKKWMSRLIGKWLKNQDQRLQPMGPNHNKSRFWQYESYDRIVRDENELFQFRRYISQNPEKAALRDEQFHLKYADWLDPFAPRP